jgi:uncharacterized protein (DUF983 family)
MDKQEKNRGVLSSIFLMKCPRCREGDLFYTHTFSYSRPTEMPDKCEICKQSFSPEPGCWVGAMFVSYIGLGFACSL